MHEELDGKAKKGDRLRCASFFAGVGGDRPRVRGGGEVQDRLSERVGCVGEGDLRGEFRARGEPAERDGGHARGHARGGRVAGRLPMHGRIRGGEAERPLRGGREPHEERAVLRGRPAPGGEEAPTAFLENVRHLETHGGGETFRAVIGALGEIGYRCRHAVLNAMEYGNVPQNRERIYIVGFQDEGVWGRFRFPKPVPLTKAIRDVADLKSPVDERYYYREGKHKGGMYAELEKAMDDPGAAYQWRRKYVRKNKSGVIPALTANMGGGRAQRAPREGEARHKEADAEGVLPGARLPGRLPPPRGDGGLEALQAGGQLGVRARGTEDSGGDGQCDGRKGKGGRGMRRKTAIAMTMLAGALALAGCDGRPPADMGEPPIVDASESEEAIGEGLDEGRLHAQALRRQAEDGMDEGAAPGEGYGEGDWGYEEPWEGEGLEAGEARESKSTPEPEAAPEPEATTEPEGKAKAEAPASVAGTWLTEGYDPENDFATSYSIELKEDGTAECVGYRNKDSGTYKAEGNKVEIAFDRCQYDVPGEGFELKENASYFVEMAIDGDEADIKVSGGYSDTNLMDGRMFRKGGGKAPGGIADGEYDTDEEYSGSLSADGRTLTIETGLSHYDEEWEMVPDYPKERRAFPVSEGCRCIVYQEDVETSPVAERIGFINEFLSGNSGLPISLKIEGGELVEMGFSS